MSKMIDGLKGYYIYRHGRILPRDKKFIAEEFVKENYDSNNILFCLLCNGYDLITIDQIIKLAESLRGKQ